MTQALNIVKGALAWIGLLGGAFCLVMGFPQMIGLFAMGICASLVPSA